MSPLDYNSLARFYPVCRVRVWSRGEIASAAAMASPEHGMSEQPPINDARSEASALLPADSESIIREDLERIRNRKRASSIACWVLLVLFVDFLVMRSIDFGVRDRTFVNGFQNMGRTVSFTRMTAHFYQTPEGVRIVSELGHDREAIEAQFNPFPPGDWTPIATADAFPPYFHPDGHGWITPARRVRDYRLIVMSPDGSKLLTDPKWREMYCDWLATGVAWKSPCLDEYVAGLRKGDHVETSGSALLLLHDFAFLTSGCMCAGATLVGMMTRTPRSARRIRRGHCPHCSYDLLSDFSRGCPECGWGKEH